MGPLRPDKTPTGRIPFQLLNRSGRAVEAGDGHVGVEGWTVGTYIDGLFQTQSVGGTSSICLQSEKVFRCRPAMAHSHSLAGTTSWPT